MVFGAALIAAVVLTGAPLGPPTPSKVKKLLLSGESFSAVESNYTFSADRSVSANGLYLSRGTGLWSLNGTRLSITGHGTTMIDCESKKPERDCAWTFSAEWDVLAVSDNAMVVSVVSEVAMQMEIPSAPQLLICRTGERNVKFCELASFDGHVSLSLIAGNSDRTLFDSTRAVLATQTEWLIVDAEPAKKPRTVSELFFGPGREVAAQKLAAVLEPTLGTIAVKPWPSETPFDLLLVVGSQKGDASDASVVIVAQPTLPRLSLSDGKCVSAAACTNATLAAVKSALPTSGFEFVKPTPIKKARSDTEVWFRAGFEAQARSLATGALERWVKPENVKEWTWPGAFDVLIVVGER